MRPECKESGRGVKCTSGNKEFELFSSVFCTSAKRSSIHQHPTCTLAKRGLMHQNPTCTLAKRPSIHQDPACTLAKRPSIHQDPACTLAKRPSIHQDPTCTLAKRDLVHLFAEPHFPAPMNLFFFTSNKTGAKVDNTAIHGARSIFALSTQSRSLNDQDECPARGDLGILEQPVLEQYNLAYKRQFHCIGLRAFFCNFVPVC